MDDPNTPIPCFPMRSRMSEPPPSYLRSTQSNSLSASGGGGGDANESASSSRACAGWGLWWQVGGTPGNHSPATVRARVNIAAPSYSAVPAEHRTSPDRARSLSPSPRIGSDANPAAARRQGADMFGLSRSSSGAGGGSGSMNLGNSGLHHQTNDSANSSLNNTRAIPTVPVYRPQGAYNIDSSARNTSKIIVSAGGKILRG